MLIRIYGALQAYLMISGEKRQQTLKPAGLKKGSRIKVIARAGRDPTTIDNATVTDVIKLRGGLVIGLQRETTRDSWARREGFATFEDAEQSFAGVYGPEWQSLELDVIYFKGDWLPDEI